uniref:Large ribosomal subunit protein uL18c n=1 Tax=Hydropuntia rangiferina TaxID=338881 RepID=A0A345U8J1_9FLOR|nr:ribosomal protein L18 [Hydropuntia rangiferina]AXI96777.1 ribosomal protein L18 [Hydropuntia rangiferina]UAD87458.1 ribosomal protein L18 [Hydropuntia rangiferina]
MIKKIRGTNKRPRLVIFRSNKHIYAQVIDDTCNKIITSSSTVNHIFKGYHKSYNNCKSARVIGQNIAEKSKALGIHEVIFDRQNKIYHGKIKALAEAVRQEGIKF